MRCRFRGRSLVGVELSGGLDSSSIACLSASLRTENRDPIAEFETFSLTFSGRNCDESQFFESAVRQWGLASVVVREELQELGWYAAQTQRYRDLPENPSGAMSEPILKAATDRGLRVLLNGIGGDHWFEGCSVGNTAGRRASLPRLIGGFGRLCQEMGFAAASRHARRRLRGAFTQTVGQAVPVPCWIAPRFARKTSLADRINPVEVADTVEPGIRKLRTLLNSGWTVHSNETTERSQSFAGIEGRSPFFDRRIIEFSFAIPEEQRGRGKCTKVVLRNAMRGLLPETIRNRDTKAEFGHTACHALAAREARNAFSCLRLGELGWIDTVVARRMYDRAQADHSSGKLAVRLWPLWMIFAAELWVERFVPSDHHTKPLVTH